MSEWQPIETAPTEWEPVLVWAISEDEWEDAADEEREPKPSVLVARHSSIQPGRWWLCGGSLCSVYEPTHWMPLPEAPST
jgi:hypothetical protein